MNISTLAATALLLSLGAPALIAEEPAKPNCEMCEMMKQKAAEQAVKKQQVAAQVAQNTELDLLVAEMNGNLGPKKIEAMAAIVTRLVAQAKASSTQGTRAPAPAAQADAHQH